MAIEYRFQSDGSTLGGEGPNIEYTFEYKEIVLDDSNSDDAVFVSEKDDNGFVNYANPAYSANYASHQRDEIYRYSIKFFDDYGRETSPYWIADIRIPTFIDVDAAYALFKKQTNKLVGYAISPKFTINNFPKGVTAYQILRVERTSSDRSVLSHGVIRPTMVNDFQGSNTTRGSTGYQTSVYDEAIEYFNNDTTINNSLLEFYSPEISFYTDSFPISGDYLDVYGYSGTDIYSSSSSTKTYHLNTDSLSLLGLYSRMFKYYDDIVESKSVLIPESPQILRSTENILEGDFPETTTFKSKSIGGQEYWTYLLKEGDNDRMARSNSSMVFSVDYTDTSDTTNWIDVNEPFKYSNTTKFRTPMVSVYKRDNYSTMYGGNDYSSRQNNMYVAITNLISVNDTATVAPFKGDSYISAFDLQPISYEYALAEDENITGASIAEVDVLPMESTVNMELRSGTYATGRDNVKLNIKYLNEDGYESRDIEPLYVYNTVYSSNNNTKKKPVIGEYQSERTTSTFNNRIVGSNRKINGEEADSWLRYPANNYLDVDSRYGNITALLNYEDKLYFMQERAVGIASVNERSLIQDNQGQQLALGTGTLLARFDYVPTDFGCSDRKSIVNTQRGLYWYDSNNNTIVKMQRGQNNTLEIFSLSKHKGVQPFLNYYNFNQCVAGNDNKHDEVLFTLSNDEGTVKTLVFNERMGVFQSLYSVEAVDYINVNRNLLSSNKYSDIYIHSRDDCNFGEFYRTKYNSELKFVVNSNIGLTKVFDVMNFINQSHNSSDKFIFYDTFDKIRVYNTYQNSDWVDLVNDNTITKRGKDWSLQVPRNAVTEDLSNNPDIFDTANLDQEKYYKERMRDKYLYVDLTYDNSDNYRFNVPLFVTKYRVSYR